MVEVLLATYNGEKYLRKQLDSILGQDYRDFTVTIRDDGSTDGTAEIIEMYLEMYPNKVKLYKSTSEYKSAISNFSELMKQAKGDYIAFCDQDDIWESSKITKEINAMIRAESAAGSRAPVLVHSDLAVVDEMLNPIAPSYMSYANIQPEKFSIKRALAESCVKSSTVLINGSMLTMCKNVPDNAISIDWWLTINAAAFAKTVYIKESLVKYRQHKGSFVGARPGKSIKLLQNTELIREMKFDTQKSYYQAREFIEKNPKGLSQDKLDIITKYGNMVDVNPFVRGVKVLAGGYTKKGIVKSFSQLINA